jgi:hypothetical protein
MSRAGALRLLVQRRRDVVGVSRPRGSADVGSSGTRGQEQGDGPEREDDSSFHASILPVRRGARSVRRSHRVVRAGQATTGPSKTATVGAGPGGSSFGIFEDEVCIAAEAETRWVAQQRAASRACGSWLATTVAA